MLRDDYTSQPLTVEIERWCIMSNVGCIVDNLLECKLIDDVYSTF